MPHEVHITLPPSTANVQENIKKTAAQKLHIDLKHINHVSIIKKSIDARNRNIKIHFHLNVYLNEEKKPELQPAIHFQNVENKPAVIIVGTGPAGLFAALRLLELGCKPVLLERGKEVSKRKKDIANIYRNHIIHPDSNYCFGEGGAGTFSDGKLYTRSKKKGDNKRVLYIFHHFGANENILYEAHPHIGSDVLPGIIKRIRQAIITHGGEIYFEEKVTDLLIKGNSMKGVITERKNTYEAQAVLLATGHSAREVYSLFHQRKIRLESKSFSAGLRVEHPQDLIDEIQYHHSPEIPYLPPATYNLATHIEGRGIYSFCMCPGGYIVPSTTSEKETVVNGMSSSKRNTPFANAGIVVEIKPEDGNAFKKEGDLSLLRFRQHLESLAWLNGGSGQRAPAQRLHDFVNAKLSVTLPANSYIPGLTSSPIHFWMPDWIMKRLKTAFQYFGKKMKGFLTNEAIVVGVESRTSSPVRIPRDTQNMQHPQISGLFPAGEGAGYAGGIVSSAIDGMLCAEKANEYLNST